MENWRKYLTEVEWKGGTTDPDPESQISALGLDEPAAEDVEDLLKYYHHRGGIMIVDDSLKEEHEDYYGISYMVKDLVDNNMLKGHTFPSVEDLVAHFQKEFGPGTPESMINREAQDSANISRMDSDVIKRYLPEGTSLEKVLEMWAKENGYDGIEELADPRVDER